MVAALQPAQGLQTYLLQAVDAEIGRLQEFYFQQSSWMIRYLVITTGHALGGRRVFVSPVAVGSVDEKERSIHVELTREQIEHSPDLAKDAPLSREQEAEYYRYYGWPPYWHLGPSPAFPLAQEPTRSTSKSEAPRLATSDHRLLLSSAVKSCALLAEDGEIGKVHDFILDTEYWAVRYLEVDTGAWLPGKHVLISPAWISRIDQASRRVMVDLGRRVVEAAPAYDPESIISRDYEVRLFGHYGREAYWQQDAKAF